MTFSTIDFANDVLDVLSEEWPDHVDMTVRADPHPEWMPQTIAVYFHARITPSYKNFSNLTVIVKSGGYDPVGHRSLPLLPSKAHFTTRGGRHGGTPDLSKGFWHMDHPTMLKEIAMVARLARWGVP